MGLARRASLLALCCLTLTSVTSASASSELWEQAFLECSLAASVKDKEDNVDMCSWANPDQSIHGVAAKCLLAAQAATSPGSAGVLPTLRFTGLNVSTLVPLMHNVNRITTANGLPPVNWTMYSMSHFDDLVDEVGGNRTNHAYMLSGMQAGDMMQYGMLQDLSELVAGDTLLSWSSFMQFYRKSGAVYGGRVVSIPLSGFMFLLYYRTDLFDRANLKPPRTWDEAITIARSFNGTDLDGDGQANDWGICIWQPLECPSFGLTVMAILASLVETGSGQQSSGLYMDPVDGKWVMTTAAWRRALEVTADLNALAPPPTQKMNPGVTDCAYMPVFRQGRCAMALAGPTQFKLDSIAAGPVPGPALGADATVIPQTTAASGANSNIGSSTSSNASSSGSTATSKTFNATGLIGSAVLPGSPMVLDWESDSLVPCDADRCPHAVLYKNVSAAADGGNFTTPTASGAAAGAASGGCDIYVNIAPYAAIGGFTAYINNGFSVEEQLATYYILSQAVALNNSWDLVAAPSHGGGPTRLEHVDPVYRSKWVQYGYEPGDLDRFLAAIAASLATGNVVTDIRSLGATEFMKVPYIAALLISVNRSSVATAIASSQRVLNRILAGMNTTALKESYAESAKRYVPTMDDSSSPAPPTSSGSSRRGHEVLVRALTLSLVAVAVLAATAVGLVWLSRWHQRRLHVRFGRIMPPGPGTQTTLCVTDIQDSTLLWERLDEELMDTALKLHNACLRRCAMEFGGYESATEGDSFILAFHTAEAALLFCLMSQDELTKVDWPERLLQEDSCAPVWVHDAVAPGVQAAAACDGGGGAGADSARATTAAVSQMSPGRDITRTRSRASPGCCFTARGLSGKVVNTRASTTVSLLPNLLRKGALAPLSAPPSRGKRSTARSVYSKEGLAFGLGPLATGHPEVVDSAAINTNPILLLRTISNSDEADLSDTYGVDAARTVSESTRNMPEHVRQQRDDVPPERPLPMGNSGMLPSNLCQAHLPSRMGSGDEQQSAEGHDLAEFAAVPSSAATGAAHAAAAATIPVSGFPDSTRVATALPAEAVNARATSESTLTFGFRHHSGAKVRAWDMSAAPVTADADKRPMSLQALVPTPAHLGLSGQRLTAISRKQHASLALTIPAAQQPRSGRSQHAVAQIVPRFVAVLDLLSSLAAYSTSKGETTGQQTVLISDDQGPAGAGGSKTNDDVASSGMGQRTRARLAKQEPNSIWHLKPRLTGPPLKFKLALSGQGTCSRSSSPRWNTTEAAAVLGAPSGLTCRRHATYIVRDATSGPVWRPPTTAPGAIGGAAADASAVGAVTDPGSAESLGGQLGGAPDLPGYPAVPRQLIRASESAAARLEVGPRRDTEVEVTTSLLQQQGTIVDLDIEMAAPTPNAKADRHSPGAPMAGMQRRHQLVFRGFRVRMGCSSGVDQTIEVSYNSRMARVIFTGRPIAIARAVGGAALGGMVLLSETTHALITAATSEQYDGDSQRPLRIIKEPQCLRLHQPHQNRNHGGDPTGHSRRAGSWWDPTISKSSANRRSAAASPHLAVFWYGGCVVLDEQLPPMELYQAATPTQALRWALLPPPTTRLKMDPLSGGVQAALVGNLAVAVVAMPAARNIAALNVDMWRDAARIIWHEAARLCRAGGGFLATRRSAMVSLEPELLTHIGCDGDGGGGRGRRSPGTQLLVTAAFPDATAAVMWASELITACLVTRWPQQLLESDLGETLWADMHNAAPSSQASCAVPGVLIQPSANTASVDGGNRNALRAPSCSGLPTTLHPASDARSSNARGIANTLATSSTVGKGRSTLADRLSVSGLLSLGFAWRPAAPFHGVSGQPQSTSSPQGAAPAGAADPCSAARVGNGLLRNFNSNTRCSPSAVAPMPYEQWLSQQQQARPAVQPAAACGPQESAPIAAPYVWTRQPLSRLRQCSKLERFGTGLASSPIPACISPQLRKSREGAVSSQGVHGCVINGLSSDSVQANACKGAGSGRVGGQDFVSPLTRDLCTSSASAMQLESTQGQQQQAQEWGPEMHSEVVGKLPPPFPQRMAAVRNLASRSTQLRACTYPQLMLTDDSHAEGRATAKRHDDSPVPPPQQQQQQQQHEELSQQQCMHSRIGAGGASSSAGPAFGCRPCENPGWAAGALSSIGAATAATSQLMIPPTGGRSSTAEPAITTCAWRTSPAGGPPSVGTVTTQGSSSGAATSSNDSAASRALEPSAAAGTALAAPRCTTGAMQLSDVEKTCQGSEAVLFAGLPIEYPPPDSGPVGSQPAGAAVPRELEQWRGSAAKLGPQEAREWQRKSLSEFGAPDGSVHGQPGCTGFPADSAVSIRPPRQPAALAPLGMTAEAVPADAGDGDSNPSCTVSEEAAEVQRMFTFRTCDVGQDGPAAEDSTEASLDRCIHPTAGSTAVAALPSPATRQHVSAPGLATEDSQTAGLTFSARPYPSGLAGLPPQLLHYLVCRGPRLRAGVELGQAAVEVNGVTGAPRYVGPAAEGATALALSAPISRVQISTAVAAALHQMGIPAVSGDVATSITASDASVMAGFASAGISHYHRRGQLPVQGTGGGAAMTAVVAAAAPAAAAAAAVTWIQPPSLFLERVVVHQA